MKKHTLIIAAALLAALSGCGDGTPVETTAPTQQPTAAAPTAAPTGTAVPEALPSPSPDLTAEPTVSPDPEPTQTPAPTATPSPEPETVAPTEIPLPEPSVEPETEASPEPLPAPEFQPPLTNSEVQRAYYEAEEAYSWFAGYGEAGLELDLNDVLAEGDAVRYRVTRPGLTDLDSLRAYLKTLFSDEIVDALVPVASAEDRLAHPEIYVFAETDNGLYARPAGRGKDVTKGTVILDVAWAEGVEPTLCSVNITVQLMQWDDQGGSPTVAGEQRYEFPYQKVGDKWVFTRFESIF